MLESSHDDHRKDSASEDNIFKEIIRLIEEHAKLDSSEKTNKREERPGDQFISTAIHINNDRYRILNEFHQMYKAAALTDDLSDRERYMKINRLLGDFRLSTASITPTEKELVDKIDRELRKINQTYRLSNAKQPSTRSTIENNYSQEEALTEIQRCITSGLLEGDIARSNENHKVFYSALEIYKEFHPRTKTSIKIDDKRYYTHPAFVKIYKLIEENKSQPKEGVLLAIRKIIDDAEYSYGNRFNMYEDKNLLAHIKHILPYTEQTKKHKSSAGEQSPTYQSSQATITAMINERAKKEITQEDKTKFLQAVKDNNHEVIDDYLQKCVSTNKKDLVNVTDKMSGETALHIAVENNNIEVVSKLLASGGNIKLKRLSRKMTPLDIAAKNGNIEIFNILLNELPKAYGSTDIKSIPDIILRDALYYAVESGSIEIVRKLIELKTEVNKTGLATDDPPLYVAAEKGHLEVVKALIDAVGTDVNRKSRYDYTPLYIAAKEGHLEVVETLIEAGAEIKKGDFRSPLLIAAEKGHTDIVKKLIAAGADPDAGIYTENEETPIYLATKNGHTDIVKMLIDSGADVNQIVEFNYTIFTPLYIAAASGDTVLCKALIAAGADTSQKGGTNKQTPIEAAAEVGCNEIVELLVKEASKEEKAGALFNATEEDHDEVVRILIDNGVELNQKNYDGNTALHIAIEEGCDSIVETLIKAGADVNLLNDENETTLHLASASGNTDIVNSLIKAGAGVDLRNDDNETALHIASKNGYTNIVNSLIKGGADINLMNAKNENALYLAAKNGHVDVVQALIKAGADINQTTTNWKTPLPIAAENGHTDVVQVLIDAGADINIKVSGKDNETPLCIAVRKGHIDTVNALIKAGADVNRAERPENTALHIAARNGDLEMVKTLLRHDEIDLSTLKHKVELSEEELIELTGNPRLNQYIRELFGDTAWGEKLELSLTQIASAFGHEEIASLLQDPKSFESRLSLVEYTGDIDDELYCPISGSIMNDPIIIRTNNFDRTYDRSSITAWLEENNKDSNNDNDTVLDPFTKQPITRKQLEEARTDDKLREKLEAFVSRAEAEHKENNRLTTTEEKANYTSSSSVTMNNRR